MTLINCNECNKEISDKAAACPHCGVTVTKTGASCSKTAIGCFVLLMLFFSCIPARKRKEPLVPPQPKARVTKAKAAVLPELREDKEAGVAEKETPVKVKQEVESKAVEIFKTNETSNEKSKTALEIHEEEMRKKKEAFFKKLDDDRFELKAREEDIARKKKADEERRKKEEEARVRKEEDKKRALAYEQSYINMGQEPTTEEEEKGSDSYSKTRKQKTEIPRETQIKNLFNLWDGSQPMVNMAIERKLHNPKSFEHVKTLYLDKGDYILVTVQFRGSNMLGALVLNTAIAKIDLEGNVLDLSIIGL